MNAKTLLLLMSLGLAACSNGPPTSEMERRLALEMPAIMSLDSFSVELTENVGTEQTPVYVTRFTASAKAKETTYELLDILEERQLIREKLPAGHEIEFYGNAQSRRSGDSWQFNFYLEGLNQSAYGSRRASFADDAVIEGTEEAAAWIREAKELREAREEQARIAAEQARIERERKEKIARERRAALEAFTARHNASIAPETMRKVCGTYSTDVHNFLVTALGDQEEPGRVTGGAPHYTSGSHFSTVVVHAGLLNRGEIGVVRVRCDKWKKPFASVPRHGITSERWDSNNAAYTVALVEKAPHQVTGAVN